MEREDRERIVTQALTVLARKLTPNDSGSLVTFSRTPSADRWNAGRALKARF